MVAFCQNRRIVDIIGHFERILFVTNFRIEVTNAGPTKSNDPPINKKGTSVLIGCAPLRHDSIL